MKYNDKYLLSLKDLSLAEHITQIIDMGVDCLKIEGRMRSPIYVGAVTGIYRKLLDERRNATETEMNILRQVFSRSGFTDSYFTGEINENMCGVRSEEDINLSKKFIDISLPTQRKLPPITIKTRTKKPLFSEPKTSIKKHQKPGKPVYTARFMHPKQVCGQDFFAISYLPLDKYEPGICNGVLLPPSIFPCENAKAEALLEKARSLGAEHAMICNVGQIELAKKYGFILHGDFRLNIFNSYFANFLFSLSLRDMIVSPELTLPQIRDITAPVSAIVYGKVPIMLLSKPLCNGITTLNDRKNVDFSVVNEFGYQEILNSVPFWMGDKQKVLDNYNIRGRHFIFTTETKKECQTIIEDYKNSATRVGNIRRINIKN